MIFVLTYFLLIAALIGDVVSTVKVIETGGHESNPIMRWLINKFGLWNALTVSHIGGAIVIGLVGLWYVNLIVAAVFAAVTFHNVGQIRK